MKFFLISQVFYPDEVSTANLFTILCKELVRKKVEVEVWAGQSTYTRSRKMPKEYDYEGMTIRYLPSTRFHKSRWIGRVINMLTFTASAAFHLLLSKDKTPVFTHTTPPSLGIILAWICKHKGRKFTYILLDIFPEGLVRLGKLSDNVFVKAWRRMFIKTLKRSNKILVLGRDMSDYVLSIYPGSKNKIQYVPHWQDENLIKPIDFSKNPFILKNNLLDQFVVQYSGNMGLWNNMEPIGSAAAKSISGVTFLFIGGGMRHKELLATLENSTTDNVRLFPFQPVENLNVTLTACHVALVSLRKGMEGMAVPSKIYGILASGVPVIALVPNNSEIAYVVNEEECGLVTDPDSVDALIEAINFLKNHQNLCEKMGKNARKAFIKKYTTSIIAEQYEKIIQDLIEID